MLTGRFHTRRGTVDTVNSDSLGLQFVNILVNQLDGEIEVKRDKGTEFTIWINVTELV